MKITHVEEVRTKNGEDHFLLKYEDGSYIMCNEDNAPKRFSAEGAKKILTDQWEPLSFSRTVTAEDFLNNYRKR